MHLSDLRLGWLANDGTAWLPSKSPRAQREVHSLTGRSPGFSREDGFRCQSAFTHNSTSEHMGCEKPAASKPATSRPSALHDVRPYRAFTTPALQNSNRTLNNQKEDLALVNRSLSTIDSTFVSALPWTRSGSARDHALQVRPIVSQSGEGECRVTKTFLHDLIGTCSYQQDFCSTSFLLNSAHDMLNLCLMCYTTYTRRLRRGRRGSSLVQLLSVLPFLLKFGSICSVNLSAIHHWIRKRAPFSSSYRRA